MTGRIITASSGSSVHVGGRLPPKPEFLAKISKMKDHYATIPNGVPSSIDYSPAADTALHQMYCNDTLGCCTIAAVGHCEGVWSGNANNGVPATLFTNEQVIAAYSACGGYVPGDASTDNGCEEDVVLNYWKTNGLPVGGSEIAGFLLIDANNVNEVKAALWLFEVLYAGTGIPESWTQVQGDGFVWDSDAPVEANGHAFAFFGFDDIGVKVSTWGMKGTLTWAGLAHNIGQDPQGQLYAIISRDMLNKASLKSPSGLDWAAIGLQFAALATV